MKCKYLIIGFCFHDVATRIKQFKAHEDSQDHANKEKGTNGVQVQQPNALVIECEYPRPNSFFTLR